MEHDTAGDPVSGTKWTRRTTAKVADELASAGIEVCPSTVAGLPQLVGKMRLLLVHRGWSGA